MELEIMFIDFEQNCKSEIPKTKLLFPWDKREVYILNVRILNYWN